MNGPCVNKPYDNPQDQIWWLRSSSEGQMSIFTLRDSWNWPVLDKFAASKLPKDSPETARRVVLCS